MSAHPSESPRNQAGRDLWHMAYGELLSRLELADEHRDALLDRGLTTAWIEGRRYRSLPGDEALSVVLARFDYDASVVFPGVNLEDVPGFFRDDVGNLRLVATRGLLIPVTDVVGMVVALKLRKDVSSNGPKYLYVSGAGPGLASCGSPVHVPAGHGRQWPIVRVTEGELKADVATCLSEVLTVSVPGVKQWPKAIPVLRSLEAETVLVSFDRDPAGWRERDPCAAALVAAGFTVEVEDWQATLGKGIDDVLRTHGSTAVHRRPPIPRTSVGCATGGHERRAERPVQRLRAAFEKAGRSISTRGSGFRTRCPAHLDEHPSLDVDEGDDGRALVICRSQGCAVEEIVAAVGLKMSDLFPAAAPSSIRDEKSPTLPSGCHLPEDFWASRQSLARIRQAAHSRQRSGDAVLHAVLARVAAGAPHLFRLPPIVGSAVPLCYFGLLLAPPGVGKSSGSDVASELVHLGPHVADRMPIGSGKGIVEMLFDMVDDPDHVGRGRPRKIKAQVRNNVYLYVDEGQVVGELGNRSGAILLPTLRTIWTGGTLGQANATQERKRVAPAGSYSYGLVVGMQTTKGGALLADVAAGTPQRFAWASAYDPSVPEATPEWPGSLEWQPPALDQPGREQYLAVAPEIQAEIRARDLQRIRTGKIDNELDAHGDLLRLKQAALLTLLEGRVDVGLEDWRLAGILRSVSNRSGRRW